MPDAELKLGEVEFGSGDQKVRSKTQNFFFNTGPR